MLRGSRPPSWPSYFARAAGWAKDWNIFGDLLRPDLRRRSNVEPSSSLGSTGEGTSVVSLQVLQEYFVTDTRELHLDAKIARRKVELLAEFDLVVPDLDDVLAAIALYRLNGFSLWDALVLRAAKGAACIVLFSEDLHPGRGINGVQIVNPFV